MPIGDSLAQLVEKQTSASSSSEKGVGCKTEFLVKKYKLKYKKVGVLPIRIVKSNILSVGPSSERNIKGVFSLFLSLTSLFIIGSTPIFLYFNLYLNTLLYIYT